jgi:opacity protein-like surface antigen
VNKKTAFYIIVFLSVISGSIDAQNTRLSNYNAIGWYNYFGTFKVSQKFGIHTEYQFRRTEIITEWQQSLLRVGVNYQFNPKIQFRLGYAWIETFPYGEIPINGMGKDFTEHRLFQMATLTDKVSIVDLSHRFMLEQRWVGRYSNANLTNEDEFPLLNRFRYMFRLQIPLKGKETIDKTPYLSIYDEIFIGFGDNVNENIFDQNRIGILLGYRFSSLVRIEAGYLNQTLQLGREVNSRNVFQRNNGIIVNANFNIDLTTRK